MKAPALLALIGAIAGGAWLALWRLDLGSVGVEPAATPPAVTAAAANTASQAASCRRQRIPQAAPFRAPPPEHRSTLP